MLNIDMEFKKGILFVRLNGILNGDTCSLLDEHLTSLISDNGIKYVLLNLDSISYIDKYGVDIIIKNYINICKNKGKLIIVGMEKMFNYNTNIFDRLYQINDESKAFNVVNI